MSDSRPTPAALAAGLDTDCPGCRHAWQQLAPEVERLHRRLDELEAHGGAMERRYRAALRRAGRRLLAALLQNRRNG